MYIHKTLVFVALLLFSFNGYSQQGIFKTALNDQLKFTGETHSVVNQSVMGQAIEMRFISTINSTYKVIGIKDKAYILEYSIDKLKYSAVFPLISSQSFDSELKDSIETDETRNMRSALATKYIINVNEQGMVTSVQILENDHQGHKWKPSIVSEVLREFIPGLTPPLVGDKFLLATIAKKNKRGEGWKDSTVLSNNFRYTVDYVVDDYEDGEVTIEFNEKRTDARTFKDEDIEMSITANDTTSGGIVVNHGNGIIRSKKATTTSNGVWTMFGHSNPYTRTTKTIITVSK